MTFLKQYRLVVAIFLLFVVLVLFRTYSRNGFRYDAVRWAEPSVHGTNIVTEDQLPSLGGEILFISLGAEAKVSDHPKGKSLIMNPESVLYKENLALIRKHKGPVILCSDDGSVTARVWMVLSEMGLRNVYILRII